MLTKKFIREALGGCDLFLFPTLEETEGIPIIEACSMQTPILVRDIEIFRDWFKENEDVYKARDVDEFVLKTKQIVEKKLPLLAENEKKKALEKT